MTAIQVFSVVYLWSTWLSVANTAQLRDLYTQWYKGDGTYYGANGHLGGNCQLSQPTPTVGQNNIINKYVAINAAQWFNSFSCGMCFRMKGEGKGLGANPITGDFYVYVKDQCPGCKAGDLDLSENGDGRWDIEIKAVECPVDATNAKIKYKFQGSNPWYLKVQIRNERVPITSFKLWNVKTNSWGLMKRTSDGFWELDSGVNWKKPLEKPLKVQLFSSVNGQTIDDTIPSYDNDKEIDGKGVQFTRDSSLDSADGGSGSGATPATTAKAAPTLAPNASSGNKASLSTTKDPSSGTTGWWPNVVLTIAVCLSCVFTNVCLLLLR